jgi:hypothetical protein
VVLFLKILGGFAAVGLGIYLGLGENRQTADEMQQLLGRGKPRKAKRHFMWLNYMKATKRASQRRAKRTYFSTATGSKNTAGAEEKPEAKSED